MNFNKFLKQLMYYWPLSGTDETGSPTHGTPLLVACRWEDKCEEILSITGSTFISMSKLLMVVPIPVGSYVYLRKTGDVVPETPAEDARCHLVRAVNEIPDIQAKKVLYEVWL